ncbi:zinc finger, CCHC-type containing protein [Tanacetum coccineum]
MMTGTKFDIKKFDEKNDFGLWQIRMKALLKQQGLAAGGITKAKGDGGEGFYVRGDLVRGIWSRIHIVRGQSHREEAADSGVIYVSGSGADGYDNVDVMMAMSVEELLDWIMDSGSSYYITYRRDYVVDFKEYDGGNILLGDGRECRVRGTCKVQVQMRDGSSFVLDNVRYVLELRRNLISLGTLEKEGFTVKMQSGKIKVKKGSLMVLSGTRRSNCVYTLDSQVVTRNTLQGRKQLGEYQIGWKIKTGNVLDSCNQRSTQQCTKSGVAKHLGVAGLQQQNGLVKETNVTLFAKVVLYRNMGFNESGEYKKTFIGSGVGTGSMQVLQGDEFEVEPQDGHTFEVEPHGNVDHVVGSQEYREDSNEAAFAVAAVEKIYAHESLTFNDTVACECSATVARNAVTTVMAITGSLHQSRIHNEKLVQTLLKGHSILSLEGSLSGDCDVEKNGKWSCIYAVGSQEYQMVCTRLDIASADVGMLDKFDRGLQTDVQVFVDFDYAMAAYMTLTEAAKEAIWLKRLAIESGFELKIVAGIATGALSKAIPSPRFQHRLNLLSIDHYLFKRCGLSETDSSNTQQQLCSKQNSQKIKKLKPLHWEKIKNPHGNTFWGEIQNSDEALKVPKIDRSELESLFPASDPKAEPKLKSQATLLEVQFFGNYEPIRAINCEIILSKVKIPLNGLMDHVLALDDSAMDADQVDILIKHFPTDEEMEILKKLLHHSRNFFIILGTSSSF